MPKIPKTPLKKETDEDEPNSARDKFKGELSKLYDTDSSDSDDYRTKRTYRKQKGDRPARRPRVRTSNYVRDVPQPAFVMKLFDRSVDLTQFKPDSPLYPICRAWFRNNPKYNIKKDPYKKKEERPQSSRDIFHLPLALPPDPNVEYITMPPKRTLPEDFNVDYDPTAPLPSKEELLDQHHERWVKVKSKVRAGLYEKEKRFKDSLDIIRTFFYSRV